MFNGELPSGHTPGIVAVAQGFFDRWNVHIAALGAYAAIGGPSGPKPDTINDRVMHCLGSTFFRRPFSLLEKQVNIAKGNLFAFKNPVGLDAIKKAAKLAASVDTKAAVDKTLSLIRVGYAVFEYINDQNSVSAYTIVNTQMRLQLGYIEQVTGVTTLVDWWDAWFADFGSEIGRKGQTWATQALNLVEQIVVDANQDRANQGLRPMAVTQSIMAGLDDFRARIPELVFPVLNQIPTLGPP